MHFLPQGIELFNLKSAFSNWEPAQKVGVRRTNLKSQILPRTVGPAVARMLYSEIY